MGYKLSSLIVLPIISVTVVTAQEDCYTLLRGAVETTRVVCAPIDVNQLCYGSRSVEVDTSSEVTFDEPGKLMDVALLEALETRSTDDGYAMILARTQAYLLDSWQEQDVTLLAYGDVTIENVGQENAGLATLDVKVADPNGANVRAEPSTDAAIVAQLIAANTTKATGRLVDNTWLRVMLRDGRAGWVFSGAVTPGGGVTTLAEVTPNDAPPTTLYRPLQAFIVSTTVEDAPCPEAPDSGLIIQSPVGVGEVELQINHVSIHLEGTLHFQSYPDELFALNVIEGMAQVDVEGNWLVVEGGMGVLLPAADDMPVEPLPYDYSRLYMLPASLLPRPILVVVRPETFIVAARLGVDPLEGLTPDSPCTVAASTDVNLRAGPGSNYRLRIGGMKSGESAHPDGKATGSDGRVWWRLVPHVWVSSDAVYALGMCYALPAVEVPPP